jgi:hypothetical protein
MVLRHLLYHDRFSLHFECSVIAMSGWLAWIQRLVQLVSM